MNNYIIIGFLLGALLVTVYFFITRTRARSKDLTHLQKPVINLTDSELIAQVRQLMKSGNKIEAIKLIRTHTNSSLLDAKNHVENLEKNIAVNNTYQNIENVNTSGLKNDDVMLLQIRKLLSEGKKIQAIKLVVDNKKMGLKDAKDFVEGLE